MATVRYTPYTQKGSAMSSARRATLVAGLLYVSTHVTSIAAAALFAVAWNDPGAARSALLAAALLEIALALGVLGTGVVLLPLLAPHGPASAQAFSALRTLEAAVIAAGTLPAFALAAATTFDESAIEAAASIHAAAFMVGQGLVISVNTVILAALLTRAGLVARWIGVLGLAGGSLVLLGNIAQVTGVIDRAGVVAALAAVPVFAFEIAFACTLIFAGLRRGVHVRAAVALDADAPV